ncbi:hypothetical protein EMPS_04046 [Entomortierella parvispora]|uniref:Uncharacterized protein n=1 Tax=Entomortierella parvispora TaxID=205924 RepID=A0A9P3H7W2_9FUNG|nr:hypothetical protein EMPS_04046 [Entomortierella parvispora]
MRMMRGSCLWLKKTKTVDKMFSTSLAVGSVVSISPTVSSSRSRGIRLQCISLFYGQSIVLPSMESRLEEPDLDRRKLYALVLGRLVSTQGERLTEKKYDQSRCPYLRGALVGLTGV